MEPMKHFATITQTRHGYHAEFNCLTSDPSGYGVTSPRWRRTRASINRAADRKIRQLDARDAMATRRVICGRTRTETR